MALTSRVFLGSLMTAMPITLMSFASCVSYAQLMRPTPLSVGFLAAASFFSAGLSNGIGNLVSSCPFLVTAPDMTFTLFISRGQESVTASTVDHTLEQQRATALVALHLGAVLLGTVFAVLGKLRTLAALRYLPYPVIAGFLAMIGAAVVKGALKILSTGSPSDTIARIIAITFAVVIIALKQRGVPTNQSSPILIICSLVAFYSWALSRAFASGAPFILKDLADEGWLLPPSAQASSPFSIFSVDWSAVDFLKTLPGTDELALVLVASINRALTVGAIESAISDEPYNVHTEMASEGVATIIGGSIGGVAMNPTSAMTTLCKEGGKGDKLAGRCTVAMFSIFHLILWASGFPLTDFLPPFLLAGLLMVMGGGMIMDWAFLINQKLQWTGSITIFAMVLTSLFSDMNTGIGLGAVLALGFVGMRFAKLEVLKYHVSGIHFRSGEQYSDTQRNILRKYGDRTQVVGLTGFVFEGVAISLAKYLKQVITTTGDHLEILVIDCAACQGINDSACYNLAKVAQMCGTHCIRLIFCNLNPYDEDLLRRWNFESNNCRIMSSLTEALQSTEQETLSKWNAPCIPRKVKTKDCVAEIAALRIWLGDAATQELLKLAPLQSVKEGRRLSVENQLMDKVFVAVPGFSCMQLEVQTGTQNKPAVLLRTELGAVCAPEPLIGSHCRGTWRTQTESVGVILKIGEELNSTKHILPRLISEGFKQQLHQADQLSALYTLSRGGGWRGVTLDAGTSKGVPSKALSDIGPRLRKTHTERQQRSMLSQCSLEAEESFGNKEMKKQDSQHSQESQIGSRSKDSQPDATRQMSGSVFPAVGAVLDFQRFISPGRTFSPQVSPSLEQIDTFAADADSNAEDNVVLNRYSVKADQRTPQMAVSLSGLFSHEEIEEAKSQELTVSLSGLFPHKEAEEPPKTDELASMFSKY